MLIQKPANDDKAVAANVLPSAISLISYECLIRSDTAIEHTTSLLRAAQFLHMPELAR